MKIPVQTILRELTALPHRGTATPQGSEAARLLQSYLAEMGATTRMEPFQTPKTYATIVYWLIGGIVAGLVLIPFTGVSVGFVWYFGFLAWKYFNWRYSFIVKFPVQHTANNVIGKWKDRGGGEDRRKVILMAHYDTAPVSLLYSPKQQAGFRASLLISLWLMLLAASLATLEVFGVALPYLTYIRYGLIGYFILQAIIGTAGYWLKGYTNGASDNATGVAAALATANRLNQANLPGLDVEVVLTSAEEVGMLGAYYFVEAHKREWKRTQTMVINFDTLGAGRLTVVEKTGTAEIIEYKNEPTRIARQLIDTELFQDRAQVGRWHTADFDSVWFVRNRIPVLALCALNADGQMPRIHQPDDTLAFVDTTPIETAVDLGEAVVKEWLKTHLAT
ncbi:M20/M25/M40 family metallo-hydrolase [Spirosoma sp. KCTC 42546]|uniref:M20/M25/M40 family metallo-hydrolase n=1 Tax=Spirosoma sp. KCTC 42546 TaxID=2520506 RepID=UPI00115B9076|nr:M20/M25/M40 family metallo-hydrolase [Spirosoma sp. KCTC 42546]QDK79648.1 M20/M25/M40 family metallo-hydrolase [Spirosoma sp. KCTC 42546]